MVNFCAITGALVRKWMKDKDVIEIEFEGLGVLRNQVLKQSKK